MTCFAIRPFGSGCWALAPVDEPSDQDTCRVVGCYFAYNARMHSWWFRSGSAKWRVRRGSEVSEQDDARRVPPLIVRGKLERLVSSSPVTLRSLYEAVGGVWPWVHDSRARSEFESRVINVLMSAFEAGTLVALEEGRRILSGTGTARKKGQHDTTAEEQPQQTIRVTPKILAEYKVFLLDRKLSDHQDAGEQKLRPEPVYVELWLEQDVASPLFDKGAKLQATGGGKVDFYEDKELKTKIDIAQPLPNAKVTGGRKLKLWAVGSSAGKLELKLEPEDSSKPEFTKGDPAQLKMGVVELKSRLYSWDTATPPAQQALSDQAKVKAGRLLHVQGSGKDHARARLVIEKLDAAEWPDGTDDHEIVLTRQGSGGDLELFDAEWDGNAHPLPFKLKKSDLASQDKELWIQGKTASSQPLDTRLDIGLDRPSGGAAKTAKTGGDWARFTLFEIEKVAPSDQFDSPSASYEADKHEVLVNIQPDGHKLKVKARLKPALVDVPLYFMLAADKDNGKAANAGAAVPAGLTNAGGTAWTWEDIDTSLKKKDQADPGDYWHLSSKTDAKGEAEAELQFSQIGGDVFRVGVYFGQDPHFARYKHGDANHGKRKPVLSKALTVWRKLWYQLAMADSCGAPRPDRAERAYQRIKVHQTAGNTKRFTKADLPTALQDVTFYPEWMIKPGGGDTEVAVVGGHNWAHFRSNEATFFPQTHADEMDTLKSRILVVDYQWDPEGWTGTKRFMTTTKVSGLVRMDAIVVKPALRGPLIHTARWEAIKKADGSVAHTDTLDETHILITKPRVSRSQVRVELPDAANPYLADSAQFEVWVTLKLAKAESYLGESNGRHVLAVYDSSDVSDYNDTIAHEIGHSVKQTPAPPAQPKGMPDHAWWNRGMGVHCANPTTPTVRNPVTYPAGSSAAQTAALCLMFESGPVPTAGNRFCDFCHQYLLAQDMTSIG